MKSSETGASSRRRLSGASFVSLIDTQKQKQSPQDEISAIAPRTSNVIPVPASQRRRPVPGRSVSHAPTTSYSAKAPPPLVKKKKILGAKIDAWWSAVTKSFVATPRDERTQRSAQLMSADNESQRPVQTRTVSDNSALLPGADFTPKTSEQFERTSSLALPLPTLRHTASASELKAGKRAYGDGQLPFGALAPATWKTPNVESLTSNLNPHTRVNSAGSEPEGSSGSGSVPRADFKRRNPQLSLRLDPRYQAAGTAHKLSDEGRSHDSSSHSSASLKYLSPSPALFKEPRPPFRPAIAESTPSLTPNQRGSPLWAQTPGLVPISQSASMKLTRSGSKQSISQKPSQPGMLAPTFSMSHIRDHIKHRLSGAKHSCDKELKKIINGITAYVENELETERAFASGHESRQGEYEHTDIAIVSAQSNSMNQATSLSDIHIDDSDAGNDAEDEEDAQAADNADSRPPLLRMDTGDSVSAPISHQSRIGSPNAYSGLLPRNPQSSSRGRKSGASSPRRFPLQPKRQPLGTAIRPADLAARLEQSLHLDSELDRPVSRTSSRSTSRSRSPMPGAYAGFLTHRVSSGEWHSTHHGSRSHNEDDEKQIFLSSLQSMVAIAMEILETSVSDLTVDATICTQIIGRVQNVGKRWDDHPNWPLRGWYVQLLLAVAGLSRVSEFWAEERGFWNFNEDKEDSDVDPIVFVAKGLEEEIGTPSSAARSRAPSMAYTVGRTQSKQETEVFSTPLGIELGMHRVEEEGPTNTNMTVSAPKASMENGGQTDEAEVLREAVEEVRNATILMELQLDGESFQYLSPVWSDVVG